MSHKGHPYPAAGAFFLDNPIRRWLQPPFELIEKIAVAQSDVVVDFGCGPGYYTVELARKAKMVVAVDLSSGMLMRARKKAEKAGVQNVEFLQSDGKKIQLEDGFVDKILLVTVYHEVGESETVLNEFSRILKNNGQLIIVEVVKKGLLTAAPAQNPEALTAEIETSRFKLQQMIPYKVYGIFIFTKEKKT